jgi:hypothetical protein
MNGSTPQEKLFESMRGPATRGGARIESQYAKDIRAKDYSDLYGDKRPLTVPMHDMQTKGFDLMSGYAGAGGRAQDLAFDAEKSMKEALGGGTGYTGTQEQDILAGRIPVGPYNQMANAFTQQSQQSMLDNLAAARTGIVENQAGGSPIGNRVQARAISDNQKDINARLAGMNLGAFQTAQAARDPLARLMAQQQQAGMRAYPTISTQPMGLYGLMTQGGGQVRDIQQQARDTDIAAYEARRQRPGQVLQDLLGNLSTLGDATTDIAGLLG